MAEAQRDVQDDDDQPQKLYRVTLELEAYVMAADATEAKEVAQDIGIDDWVACDISVDTELPSLASVPVESRENVPWGSYDDRTVGQIIGEEAAKKS
jgi:hypothetical protein